MADTIDVVFRTNAGGVQKQVQRLTQAETRAVQTSDRVRRATEQQAAAEKRLERSIQQRTAAQRRGSTGAASPSRGQQTRAFLERLGSAGGVFSPIGQVASAAGQAQGLGGRAGAAIVGLSVAAAGATIAFQGLQAAEQERLRLVTAGNDAFKRFNDALKGARDSAIGGAASSALALDPLRRQLAGRTGDAGFGESFQRSPAFQRALAAGASPQEAFQAAIASTRGGKFNERAFDAAVAAAGTGEISLTDAASKINSNRGILRQLADPAGLSSNQVAQNLLMSQGMDKFDAERALYTAGDIRAGRGGRLSDRAALAARIAGAGAQTEMGGINTAEVGLRRQVFAAEKPMEAARLKVQQELGQLIAQKAELAATEGRILGNLRELMGAVGLGPGSQNTQFANEADAINAGAAAAGAP